MPTHFINFLTNILRPTWVRIVLGVLLLGIAGGVTAYILLQNRARESAQNCTSQTCEQEKHPESTEGVTSDPEKTAEEQAKKQEEKPKPSSNTPANNSQTTTDTPQAPAVTPPPTQSARACPAYPSFPDTNCTGVPPGTSLTTMSSFASTSNGQVIDGLLITGDITISHSNVTLKNSRVKGRVVGNHPGVTLQDVDLGPDSCPASNNGGYRLIAGNSFTLIRAYLHHNGDDAIALNGGGSILIEDSVVAPACFYAGDHLDSIQFYNPGGVANVTIRHSVVDSRPANSGGFGNAAIFLADFPGAGSRFNIYNNLLAGGNYTLSAYDAPSGSGVIMDISGNRFVRNQYNYGPCGLSNSDPFDGTSGVIWTNNAFTDGAAIQITDC